MYRLIKAELYKLFRVRTFVVLCVIAIAMGVLVAGITKLVSSEDFIRDSLKGMSPEMQDQFLEQIMGSNAEDAPIFVPGSIGFQVASNDIFNPIGKEVFHSAFGAGVIEILLVVLLAAVVAGEYSSGTIKNILAYGKKREHFYLSKLIAGFVALAILLGIIVTVGTTLGVIMFGWGVPFTFAEVTHIFQTFGAALVVGTAVVSIMILLATLLKSNGSTIGVGITIFTLLPLFTSFLYDRYDWLDKIFEVSVTYNWALATSMRSTGGDILQAVLVSLLVILVTTIAGIIIFKKQDIK